MSDDPVQPSEQPKLLIDAATLAARLSISRTSLFTMKAAGRLPKPIRLGRSVRWNAKEIEAWVDANCPPLHVWLKMYGGGEQVRRKAASR